jgi:ABC-2 type transport system permease protein
MSFRRLWAIARKEALQLRRDPRSLVLAFVLPFLLVLVFGTAISLDVRDIPFGVLDRDRTPASRELVEAFQASGYFTLRARMESPGEADHLLARGRVRLVVVIPPGHASDLASGRVAGVQLLVDGGDANTATIAINYADAIVAGVNRRIVATRAVAAPLGFEARVWYNEALESARMIVPGLVAVIMAIIAAMLTALAIAREWERGTMEQLAATPVHRLEVVGGKLLPYIGIGVIDVTVAVVVGMVVFDVPLRGSVVLLAAMSLLFLIGMLSFGLLLSAALKSQMLATQVAIMTTYLPTLLLSGFIFSIASMPFVLQVVSVLIPARFFIVITRGIFLKGIGLGILWPQALGMLAFTLIAFGMAIRTFRKEIDG